MDKLKKHIKKIEQKILEENFAFYNSITDNYAKQKKAVKRYLIPTFATAVVVSIALLFMFITPLFSERPIGDTERKYYFENEEQVDTTLDEINQILSSHSIIIQIDAVFTTIKVRDKVSGDILYFHIIISNMTTFETIDIYLYVNEYYNLQKTITHTENAQTTTIGDFTVTYLESMEIDDDLIVYFDYIAVAQYSDFSIYLEYSQMTFEEQSGFFTFFDNSFRSIN